MQVSHKGFNIEVIETSPGTHVAEIFDSNGISVVKISSLHGEESALKGAKARIGGEEGKTGFIQQVTQILMPKIRVKDILKFQRAVAKRRAKNKLTRAARRANRA